MCISLFDYDTSDPEITLRTFREEIGECRQSALTVIDFVAQLTLNAREEGTPERWEKFKRLLPHQLILENGALDLIIGEDKWKSYVCGEQYQLWPTPTSTGQNYTYISGHAQGIKYFKIRRGLEGCVGELLKVNAGPLLNGTGVKNLCMRILDFLKMGRVFLNDDAKLKGSDFDLEMRLFMPVVSDIPKTFYSDHFALWENHPPIFHQEIPIHPQSFDNYFSALSRIRKTTLCRLRRINIPGIELLMKTLCASYQQNYTRATVHSLGSVIYRALKVDSRAQADFRVFYQICFFASPKPEAKTYNRALDTLFQHKFWIKTY